MNIVSLYSMSVSKSNETEILEYVPEIFEECAAGDDVRRGGVSMNPFLNGDLIILDECMSGGSRSSHARVDQIDSKNSVPGNLVNNEGGTTDLCDLVMTERSLFCDSRSFGSDGAPGGTTPNGESTNELRDDYFRTCSNMINTRQNRPYDGSVSRPAVDALLSREETYRKGGHLEARDPMAEVCGRDEVNPLGLSNSIKEFKSAQSENASRLNGIERSDSMPELISRKYLGEMDSHLSELVGRGGASQRKCTEKRPRWHSRVDNSRNCGGLLGLSSRVEVSPDRSNLKKGNGPLRNKYDYDWWDESGPRVDGQRPELCEYDMRVGEYRPTGVYDDTREMNEVSKRGRPSVMGARVTRNEIENDERLRYESRRFAGAYAGRRRMSPVPDYRREECVRDLPEDGVNWHDGWREVPPEISSRNRSRVLNDVRASPRYFGRNNSYDNPWHDAAHRTHVTHNDYGDHRSGAKVPLFDGKCAWQDFEAQFDLISEMNGWSPRMRGMQLASALRGEALTVLGDLDEYMRRDYDALVAALNCRFGSQNQSELYRAQLKNRARQKDEGLPQLAQSIKRLAKMAYPNASFELRDTLARDHFIDALVDSDIRWGVYQSRPLSLDDAVKTAMEYEAFRLAESQRSSKKSVRVVSGSVEEETMGAKSEPNWDQVISKMVSAIESGFQSLKVDMKTKSDKESGRVNEQNKRPVRCYNCNELGHMAKKCSKPKRNRTNQSEPQTPGSGN